MNFLLDTNIISEFSKDRPAEKVIRWLRGVPDQSLFLSALTVGELRQGIEKLPTSQKRTRLRAWLDELANVRFSMRTLAIDAAVAERWGRLTAETGRSLPAIDSLLAATALEYNLTLATRNVKDFQAVKELQLLNPWET